MATRAEVPAVPDRPQAPIGEPIVVRIGEGLREFETDFGRRPTLGIHVYNYLEGEIGGNVGYHGHVNIFWEAVRAQLAGLQDGMLMACKVIKNGRRYELAAVEESVADDILTKVEALIADNDPAAADDDDAPF